MRRLNSFISFLAFLSLTAVAEEGICSPDSSYGEVRKWIEENIPVYMTESKLPGFSIAVVMDGETIYAEGFGARDSKRNLPATADTLYGIGSITKSFVAIGIMQLVEEGKISLDDPVSQHVPFELGMPGKPITIHHLLTHSLGIPSLATSSVALGRGLGLDIGIPLGSAEDFYRLVNGAQDEVVADPGERFFYHNAAWRMLGHVIQEKSGMPFHRYLKEKVIDPLDMQRTTLSLSDFESDSDHIMPHLKKADGGVEPANFPYPDPDDNPKFSFLTAAGGIVSSVNEMTKYLNAQMEKGRYPGGRLASQESFETMQKLHIRLPGGHYGESGYGYGLAITPDFLGHKMVGHGGSIVVSTAYMAFVPELKAGVVMMGNSASFDYRTVAESIFALLEGEDPATVIPAVKIAERMKRLVGNYEIYRAIERVRVLKKRGMLYVEYEDRFSDSVDRVPLIPEDPTLQSTVFHILSDGVKYPVEFNIKPNGEIDLFIGRYCYHKKS
jgi:CubicO group peptidase (beta-lactamase class C family)